MVAFVDSSPDKECQGPPPRDRGLQDSEYRHFQSLEGGQQCVPVDSEKEELTAKFLAQSGELASELVHTLFHRCQPLAQPGISGGLVGTQLWRGIREVVDWFGSKPVSPAALLRARPPVELDHQRSVACSHLAQSGLDLGKLGEGVQPAAAGSELARCLRPTQHE